MIERGETAPDFELRDQHGEPVRLSYLRGAPVVIDPGGRVADVIPKVSPKTHAEQVLKILGSM
jgi:peroxiredoxin